MHKFILYITPSLYELVIPKGLTESLNSDIDGLRILVAEQLGGLYLLEGLHVLWSMNIREGVGQPSPLATPHPVLTGLYPHTAQLVLTL